MDKKMRVRSDDPFRCLVTEVLPAETPIIFSNDGFYVRCAKHASAPPSVMKDIFDNLIKQKEWQPKKPWFVPYSYKVRKSAVGFRALSIMHPSAQWLVQQFYDFYAPLLLHYTSRSEFSVRAPKSVAKTFYIKSAIANLSKFKRTAVSEEPIDKFLRHSSSYFSYAGYSRLYKFFDSNALIRLEARFRNFWMLDVSKCFDSIYTHSISWAVKDKSYSKQHIGVPSFGEAFDSLMQSINQGETSGIIIGPEISRIFAEIILQEVDRRIEAVLLSERDWQPMRDYAIRRYVDDFFVFASSEEDAASIYAVIESELGVYKLGLNEAKLKKFVRPFLTPKSKVIIEVSKKLNNFASQLFSEPSDVLNGEEKRLVPEKIYRPDRLLLHFCNEIKLCCSENKCDYDEVSGYLISALKNRAVLLMNNSASQVKDIGCKSFFIVLSVIIRTMFFFYSVAPSVTASYRLCTSMIIILRFMEFSAPAYLNSMKNLIFSEVREVVRKGRTRKSVDGFIDLESQNLILAISDLGADYRLPVEIVNDLFRGPVPGTSSYFNLIVLMYYIKSDPLYADIRLWALKEVDMALSNMSDVGKKADIALIALDFISCPFVDKFRRETWLKKLLNSLGLPSSSPSAIEAVLTDFELTSWFTSWKEVDLLNLLERKELHVVY